MKRSHLMLAAAAALAAAPLCMAQATAEKSLKIGDKAPAIDVEHWKLENQHFAEYLDTFGDRVPEELRAEQQRVAEELDKAS